MATLYVTQNGAQLRKEGERIIVMREEQIVDDIPIIKLDQVVLVGKGVSLTTPALHALSKRGVEVVFLSGAGRFMSRLSGAEHKNVRLRHTQTMVTSDPARALEIARLIVKAKINNQRALVRRHAAANPIASASLSRMETYSGRLSTAATIDEVRGLEGAAAKDYFTLYRSLLARPADGPSWGFDRRAYYPPPDPVNALLSFGYTLLLNDLVTACQLAGLDPYLGCFHAIDYGRPSMALDLMEEFRPVIVDSLVLDAVNHARLRLADFRAMHEEDVNDHQHPPSNTPAPVYLNDQARLKFLAWYEQRVNLNTQYGPGTDKTTYRRIFLLQAQSMARAILGETNQLVSVQVR